MRWIVGAISAVVGLAVLLAIAVMVLPAEPVAGLAAQRLTAATGRAASIDGPVRVTVWPRPGVRTGPVQIAGPAWAEDPDRPMLSARSLDIGLDAAALLAGRVRIARMEAEGAEIVVERHADGRLNWVLGEATATAAPGTEDRRTEDRPDPVRPSDPLEGFDRLRLVEAAIDIRDAPSGTRQRLEGLTLDLDRDGEALRLALAGAVDGVALHLEAVAGAALLLGQDDTLAVTLTTRDAAFSFDGHAALSPLGAGGRLVAHAGGALLPALGLPATRRAALEGAVTVSPTAVDLRDGRITLDAMDIAASGTLAVDGPRPRLTGRATAGVLDLRQPAVAGPANPAAPTPGWSTAPIDARALHLLDADVALSAAALRLDAVTFEGFAGRLAIDAGRAVLGLDDARVHGGQVTGEVVANARSGFSARATLRLADLAVQPLLRDLAGYDGLEGRLSGEVALLGVGGSVDALVRSLSGQGQLTLGPGTIRGIDLTALLRDRNPAGLSSAGTTAFEGASTRFTVDGGVVRNDTLRLTSPALRAEGGGRIDLGGQWIDQRLTVAALEGPPALTRLRLPVTVTGPWAQPSVSVDLEALVRQEVEDRLRQELTRPRDDARGALQRELERALSGSGTGSAPEAPQAAPTRPEDAARQLLEREIGRGLGRLLGRD
ncbi:MAG: AsmA family protein [Alkalilacustris sp.]